METEFRCPVCHAVIPANDVNVATDLALCRACGRTSSFALVSGASQISLDLLATPPRSIRVEEDFDGTVITYRRISPAVLFLIPFTAFWSGLSMWGIYGSQFKKGQFELGQCLFGLPFLFGTIVLLSVIASLLFGKWRIALRQGEGSVFFGVGPLGWTRRFTYNRNTVVSLRLTSVRVNEVPQQGIAVQTDGTELVFGSSLKQDAKKFIAAVLTKAVVEIR
jgi:hypothetical protein